MLNIALLWHMHQPYYVNPVIKTAIMPWVRLHAVKGYLDMAEMAKRNPEINMVFNLTPVLLKQICELVNNEVKDLWEEWSKIPAAELTPENKHQLLQHFFKANWDNLIRPYPRYHELLAKRGYDLSHISLDNITSTFSKQDFLDLQVWFNLAWCGYAACAEYPELRDLKTKGRKFSEEDKLTVLSIHRKILASVLGRYRALAEGGKIEISTTPFFHPISPLIVDTDFAHRAMPSAMLPPRFQYPEDLEAQLRLSVEQHTRLFGSAPVGLWPSEGSVAPEIIPIVQKSGFRWMATDEDILFRSLARESGSHIDRSQLYDSYEAEWNGSVVHTVFRDRSLSDFIGFSASKNSPTDASSFIMHHIHGIATATESKADPLVAIVLDGENAWEYFPDGGEGFLTSWYSQLARSERWKMTTLSQFSQRPIQRRRLTQLHTGSWIQGNFDIWIGDPEENLGWKLLGETRRWWQEHQGNVSPEIAERVRMELYAAEGSDWFWWYGPDFNTDNDLLFDELFRTHLQNVYLLCNTAVPESLQSPVCRPEERIAFQEPVGLIHPTLDGLQTTYFEWYESGRYETGQNQGTMFQGEKIFKAIHYGFDLEAFYLRIDVHPTISKHPSLTLEIPIDGKDSLKYDWTPADASLKPADEQTLKLSQAAYRKIVEIRVPFAGLGMKDNDILKFQVLLFKNDAIRVELEKHPSRKWFELKIPNELFAASIWSA